MVDLVKSFHEDMKARVRVDGELIDKIEVTNGLRQECTMAPMLLNLYADVAERWLDKTEPLDGVGTLVVNKQDGLLFWRSTRNAQETMLYKGEFADDVVLLARSREAACTTAINAYVEVASSLGLKVSFPFMVIGPAVSEDDWQQLAVDESLIEWVDHFPYLGSVMQMRGRLMQN